MGKLLLVETQDITEISNITDEEIESIAPVVAQIAFDRYNVTKADNLERESDYVRYGHIDGFETFVQYIPESGIDSIKKIRVLNIEKTLLA